jgi:ADP-heptose:LPS heptosyltransferase
MWPVEHWRILTKGAAKKTGLPIIFTGSSADVPMLGAITAGIPGTYNFGGSLSLVETCALLKSCAMTVTVDSGPMHVSAAFNKPIIALFGPTSPEKTGPLTTGPSEILRADGLKCLPCFSRKCRLEKGCMELIAPEHALSRVLHMLSFLGM